MVEWKTVVLPSIVILRSLVQLLFEGRVDVSLTQHYKSTILKYTPVFLPENLWTEGPGRLQSKGHKESDMTEATKREKNKKPLYIRQKKKRKEEYFKHG